MQGFEELGEAQFFLALFGDVAPQDAGSDDLVAFDNGVDDTIEIQRARAVFQTDTQRSGPALFVEEAADAALHFLAGRFLDEIVDFLS